MNTWCTWCGYLEDECTHCSRSAMVNKALVKCQMVRFSPNIPVEVHNPILNRLNHDHNDHRYIPLINPPVIFGIHNGIPTEAVCRYLEGVAVGMLNIQDV